MLSLLRQNTFVMNMRYISRTAMLFLSRSWQCPESWWTAKRWENAWNSCRSVKWQLCPCCHLTHNSQLFLVTYANSQSCFMALRKCQHDDILHWKMWWQSYSIPLTSILPVPGVLQLSYSLLCHSYHPLPPIIYNQHPISIMCCGCSLHLRVSQWVKWSLLLKMRNANFQKMSKWDDEGKDHLHLFNLLLSFIFWKVSKYICKWKFVMSRCYYWQWLKC